MGVRVLNKIKRISLELENINKNFNDDILKQKI